MDTKKRSHRLRALGLALVASLAIAATSAASASALSFSWELPGSASLNTQMTGPVAQTLNETGSYSLACSKGAGTSAFSTGTSGSAQVTLQGCKWGPFQSNCTSAGKAAGEIALKTLLEPVYLDAAKTKYGLKVSPQTAGGPVAEFNCGGFSNVVWTGSVLGEITEPALNVTASTFKLTLQGSAGKQQYEQIEGAGIKYHLNKQANGGAVEAMSLASAVTLTLNEGQKGKFIP